MHFFGMESPPCSLASGWQPRVVCRAQTRAHVGDAAAMSWRPLLAAVAYANSQVCVALLLQKLAALQQGHVGLQEQLSPGCAQGG